MTALELAAVARCAVDTVLRAEFGIEVPQDPGLRARLAAAYRLDVATYVRLALDAAERDTFRAGVEGA